MGYTKFIRYSRVFENEKRIMDKEQKEALLQKFKLKLEDIQDLIKRVNIKEDFLVTEMAAIIDVEKIPKKQLVGGSWSWALPSKDELYIDEDRCLDSHGKTPELMLYTFLLENPDYFKKYLK